MSLTTLSLTLYYLFFHSSSLEFWNWDFFIPCRILHHKLWFKIWNSKIQYHTARLWSFKCMWWLMYLPTLSLTLYYHTFSFTPLSSSLGIEIFSFHVVAYIVSFDSTFETRKSDIIWPRYELFDACGGSYPSLPCLWHYITFSFIPLSSSYGIEIYTSHVVAYIISFDSRFQTRKSNIIRPDYDLINACGGSCPSLPCLWHYITIPAHSLLWARV